MSSLEIKALLFPYVNMYVWLRSTICIKYMKHDRHTFSSVIDCTYRISANSFRGNYSFLNLALFTVTFDLYFINLNSCRGNYSREETIQGRKIFAEIRYLFLYFLNYGYKCSYLIAPSSL